MKTYDDFTDQAFSWSGNPGNAKPIEVGVFRAAKDHIVAILTHDELSDFDRSICETESWYVFVLPYLVPRGFIEQQMDKVFPDESYQGLTRIQADDKLILATRVFAKSQGAMWKAQGILLTINRSMTGESTEPTAPPKMGVRSAKETRARDEDEQRAVDYINNDQNFPKDPHPDDKAHHEWLKSNAR